MKHKPLLTHLDLTEAVQELDVQSRTQATLSKGYADEYQAS